VTCDAPHPVCRSVLVAAQSACACVVPTKPASGRIAAASVTTPTRGRFRTSSPNLGLPDRTLAPARTGSASCTTGGTGRRSGCSRSRPAPDPGIPPTAAAESGACAAAAPGAGTRSPAWPAGHSSRRPGGPPPERAPTDRMVACAGRVRPVRRAGASPAVLARVSTLCTLLCAIPQQRAISRCVRPAS